MRAYCVFRQPCATPLNLVLLHARIKRQNDVFTEVFDLFVPGWYQDTAEVYAEAHVVLFNFQMTVAPPSKASKPLLFCSTWLVNAHLCVYTSVVALLVENIQIGDGRIWFLRNRSMLYKYDVSVCQLPVEAIFSPLLEHLSRSHEVL